MFTNYFKSTEANDYPLSYPCLWNLKLFSAWRVVSGDVMKVAAAADSAAGRTADSKLFS